jgi:hypothetical protein
MVVRTEDNYVYINENTQNGNAGLKKQEKYIKSSKTFSFFSLLTQDPFGLAWYFCW